MAEGSIKKICNCKDDNGRRYGPRCPQLYRTTGSWSPTHGWWAYQLELPPERGGTRRRQLRRSGFDTRDGAAAERDHALMLLGLAAGIPEFAAEIATTLLQVKPGQPLPDRDRLARRVKAGVTPGTVMTVAEYLWQCDFAGVFWPHYSRVFWLQARFVRAGFVGAGRAWWSMYRGTRFGSLGSFGPA